MVSPPANGGSDELDAQLRDLTDDHRVAAAAQARRREQWLRQQAAEEGTFGGVILDLAERRQPLVLDTITGRAVHGVINRVGADFVGLHTPGGQEALVPNRSVASIRPQPGGAVTVGDRARHDDATLHGVLTDRAAERPRVTLHTTATASVAGELRGVGQDLLLVECVPGDTTYVALGAVAVVVLG